MKRKMLRNCCAALLVAAITVTSVMLPVTKITADTRETIIVSPENTLNVQVKDKNGNFVNGVDASLVDDNGTTVAKWSTGTNSVYGTETSGITGGTTFNVPWSKFQEVVAPGTLKEMFGYTGDRYDDSNGSVMFSDGISHILQLNWMPYYETHLTVPGNTVVTVVDPLWSQKSSCKVKLDDGMHEISISDNIGGKVEHSLPAGSYHAMGNYHHSGSTMEDITISSNPTEYTKVRIKLSDYYDGFNDDGTMSSSSTVDEYHGGHIYQFGVDMVEENFEFRAALLIVSGSVINAPIPDENGYVEIYVDKSTYKISFWANSEWGIKGVGQGSDICFHHSEIIPEYKKQYIFKPIDLPNIGTNINNVPAGNYTVEINDISKQYKPLSKPVTISEAGNQLIEIVLEEEAVHSHTADESIWLSDSHDHWHKCSTCDEDVKLDSAAHTPGPEATETSPQTCKICGYEIAPKLQHVHDYGNIYKTDEDNHWKECHCGNITERDAHNFVWVTDKEATEGQNGFKHEQCIICGYQKDVMEIPALKSTEPDTEKPTPKLEPHTKEPEQPTQKPSTPVTGDNISATLLILIITSVVLFGGVIVVGNKKKVSGND